MNIQDWELSSIKTEISIQDNSKITFPMEQESIPMLEILPMMGNGFLGEKEGKASYVPMVTFLKEIGMKKR